MEHRPGGGHPLIYGLAIVSTIVLASGFVIGGMLAHATGLSAVLLAGSVPLAALGWAISLSWLQRAPRADAGAPPRPPPHAGPGTPGRAGVGADRRP